MNTKPRPAAKISGRMLPSGLSEFEVAGFVEGPFVNENTLEKWLAAHFGTLGLDAVLVGSQIKFKKTKKADMLAIMRDGSLCIIENKRDCAPREALAQLLDYAMELYEALASELDEILLSVTMPSRSLQDIYERAFKRPYPGFNPNKPLLILVADQFAEEEENMALFLNRLHGFRIRLVRYSYIHDQRGDEYNISLDTIVHEREEALPPVEFPPNAFLVRIVEKGKFTWERIVEKGKFILDKQADFETLSEAPEGTVVLAYLAWAGYLGYGTIIKPEPVPVKTSRRKGEKKELAIEVKWELTLPREQAYFRSQSSQPLKVVQQLKEADFWQAIVGRLRHRYKHLPLKERIHFLTTKI